MAGRKVAEVFVEVRANLSKLKSGMKSAMSIASGGASVIGKVLGGLASLIKNVLTAAFKVVGAVIKTIYSVVTTLFSSIIKWAKRGVLALSAFVALSVVVGAKFGQSMARVKALTGASTKEFKALREEARRLGRATEYSANEAADAMSIFAMAGFKTNDVITAMTPTLDFAAASGLDLASAADIAARVMGGMQLEAKDLEHTMDVLTKAFTSANMDATDLGEAMKYVGAVGKTVGKDVEEIVGALTALAAAGNRGSMAGTGLRKVLMGLATSKVQKKIAALGVSVTDASGAMKPMSKMVGDLVRATKHLSDMEIADLGVQMFGARGGVAFLQLIGQGEAAIEKYTTQLANVDGFTKKIAATQRDTLATSFKIVQSAIADVMITITDILEPTLRGAADSQVNMWNKIGAVLEANKTRIMDFIKNTIIWIKTNLPRAIHIAIGALALLWAEYKKTFMDLKDLVVNIGGDVGNALKDFFEVDASSGNNFERAITGIGAAIIKMKHFFKEFFTNLVLEIKLFILKANRELLAFELFGESTNPEVVAADAEIKALESRIKNRKDVSAGGKRDLQGEVDRDVNRWVESRNKLAKPDPKDDPKILASAIVDAFTSVAVTPEGELDMAVDVGKEIKDVLKEGFGEAAPEALVKEIQDIIANKKADGTSLAQQIEEAIARARVHIEVEPIKPPDFIGDSKSLGKTLFDKAKDYISNAVLGEQKVEMSLVGKGFHQGKFDPLGLRKIGHDATLAAGAADKKRIAGLGTGRKIDSSLGMPKMIAGFAGTIQTAIGSAKVGAPDIWEKILDVAIRQETSANRRARLEKEARDKLVKASEETAKNTGEEKLK